MRTRVVLQKRQRAYHTLCVKTECRVKRANADQTRSVSREEIRVSCRAVRRDHFHGLSPSMVEAKKFLACARQFTAKEKKNRTLT